MSKLRPVRQRTGASRQDEGPGTGAALLAGAVLGLATDAVALALPRQQARQLSAAHLAAAGGVYLRFAVADGRRSALLVRTGELLGSRRWPPWPSSATRRACSAPAGWRTSPRTPCATGAAGPPGCHPGTRRSASATTWRSLRRCSPVGSRPLALVRQPSGPASPRCRSRWARGWPPAPCTGSAARCAAAGRPAGPSSRWR
jgi:hypothetical protein